MAKQWFDVCFRVPLAPGSRKAQDAKKPEIIAALKGLNYEQLTFTRRAQSGSLNKARGKNFESDIGAILGNWWWGQPFRRTPGSGGWDKQVNDGQQLAAGDIYAPPEAKFPFSIECKKRAEPFDLFSETTEVYEWWKQCRRDAAAVGLIPLLVFSARRGSIYVAFPVTLVQKHKLMHASLLKRFIRYDAVKHDESFIIQLLSDFIQTYRRI